jgi:hypothetical protein
MKAKTTTARTTKTTTGGTTLYPTTDRHGKEIFVTVPEDDRLADVDASGLGFMQIAATAVLAAAARGEIDLNAIARRELANRGLDLQGKWVGFQQAAAIAETANAAKAVR